jgi:hypothetical protein
VDSCAGAWGTTDEPWDVGIETVDVKLEFDSIGLAMNVLLCNDGVFG